MRKTIYYIRIILFIFYLLCMFLLIDKIYTINLIGSIFFVFNLIYSFFIILSILSKKEIFIYTISYNILNIGIYIYTFVLFYFAYLSSKLDIINNYIYYKNNFLILIVIMITQIIYTIYLNTEEKTL